MFKPNFQISQKILNNIAQIIEIKTIIERSRVLPDREANLRRKAVVKMAHTSTSIEGNPLAEYEVEKVLGGGKVDASSRTISEVKNYEQALLKVNQIAGSKTKINKHVILNLHKTVMENLAEPQKVGAFRKTPVYIVNEYKDHDELAYQPPNANEIVKLIDELLEWLYNQWTVQQNPIITAGLFHYQFVTIHPFTDGNGRVTRLLTQLYLYLNGYDFRKVLVLEEYYNQNRKAYYEALQTGKDYPERIGKSLTPWLEYFTTGFLSDALKAKDDIEALGFIGKVTDGQQVFLDRDEVKIMDFINTTGRITSLDITDILKISQRASQMKLEKLLNKKLIFKNGKGPATFYTLKNIS